MSVSQAIIPYQDPWVVISPPQKLKQLPAPRNVQKYNSRPLPGRVKRILLGIGVFASIIKTAVGTGNGTVTHADRMLIIEIMGPVAGFVAICVILTICCIKCCPNQIERDIENQHLIQNE